MKKLNTVPINGVVLFTGKYGATRQYARWIGEELDIPVFDLNKFEPDLFQYDLIIMGSAIYIGNYHIQRWMEKEWTTLKDKRLILFTVSGTAPDHPDIKKYFEANLAENIRDKIKYFPLQGRLKLEDLNWLIRFFVKIGSKVEKDKDARQRMKYGFDFIRKENIEPIVEAARELVMVYQPPTVN